MKRSVLTTSVSLLASKKFFYAIVGGFVFESAWIALSGRYPMAFDENFHLGIIRLYAHQWSPWFAQQPPGPAMFGAVVRDPSYLYHWLMSFPYRLTDALFHSEFLDVLSLRFLSIALIVVGLLIFRRLLQYVPISAALRNVVFLFFALTPLTSLAAAQINYDNLLFPLVGLCLLLAVQIMQTLRRSQRLDVRRLLSLISICMVASLVKYSFLPIFAGIVVYLLIVLWMQRKTLSWRQVRAHIAIDTKRMWRQPSFLLGIAGLAAAAALFVPTYGYNLAKYHTPAPECDQVISVDRCRAYGAWNRNYTYAQSKASVSANPVTFTKHWGGTYFYSVFSVVNGEYSGFMLERPLPVLFWTALIMFWTGLAVIVLFARRVFATAPARFLGIMLLVYIATLWLQNYSDYIHLGKHVAEQGRYLIILMLAAYALVAMALTRSINVLRYRPQLLKLLLLGIGLLFVLQGGGMATYIVRTDDSWWWEQNVLARNINHAAQTVLKSLIVSAKSPGLVPPQPQ